LAIGIVHALLIACLHRVSHKHNPYYVGSSEYYGGDRLIWLYDIHLLSAELESNHWSDFAEIAKRKGLCAICLEGLDKARSCFATDYPDSVRVALGAHSGVEVPARYYLAGPIKQKWMDFMAVPGSLKKVKLLREVVFPTTTYMRERYPQASKRWLPWLYAQRALAGVRKRFTAMRDT